ncbi:hypothetical protein L6164_031389 [Bauhinia variegata]|uniref:Uncharacterized protein n=1 Tax=Bauhinia variegata TaxID=167791 RepID=A0ACB9LG67_BAUVA|nr:hypothetical protein L6164_031389 [Bauhinia variegata]
MELSTAILQPCCSIPSAFPTSKATGKFSSPVSLPIRNPVRFSSLNFSSKGTTLVINQVGRFQHFLATAVVGDRTAVPDGCSSEGLLSSGTSDEACVHGNSLGTSEKRDDNDDGQCLDDHRMVRVCDKLIDVFTVDKPTPTDWRKLIAFSKEWSNIRPHFFRRCEDRADSENDPWMKQKLLRLGRKLKEVDEDVQRHNELLEVIKRAPSEISEIMSRRRKDFTEEFFVHLHTVAESYYDNPKEQTDLANLGNSCLAAVQAYDAATESVEALQAAELKFQDIMNSPSLDAACRKIDNLAEKSQLDSTLVLMITKAWSAAKESNLMKDEVKDILYHLYKTSMGNLQRLVPKEVRIIKYLIRIEDPEEQLSALQDAFTPGEELEGTDVDNLHTTPEKLHTWTKAVVDAYHLSGGGTLIREARDLMNPAIIQKLKELNKVVENKFM